MREKKIKVVIIEPHGQIRVFPDSRLPGDVTLEDVIETAISEFGLEGNYEVYVRVKDIKQELESLKIHPREIDGLVVLADELKQKRIEFQ